MSFTSIRFPSRTAGAACAAALLLCALAPAAWTRLAAAPADTTSLTLSIVGTTDLHGYFTAREGRGGIGVFAGYVNNLRAARTADGGAVLLLDAGDTFQGGVESDLSEGAAVVDAYNALGYTALAVGNHDFEFGSVDRAGAREDASADPQGALKARAAQAHFPFLAANLLDAETGRRVNWPNVRPSTMVVAGGVKVGIIGVMTAGAMRATLPLNVRGLRTAPLVPTVTDEATQLRAAGATVVVVAAHAGGWCERFDNPYDTSSCDESAEIFDLARGVPAGLVDAIVAGHTHAGLGHVVAGIPIVQGHWGGRAFGRIDLTVNRASGRVVASKPFAPIDICAEQDAATHACTTTAQLHAGVATLYEGRPVVEDRAVLAAMEPALARVRALQATPLGVVLERPLARTGDPESPLGNLFADALRERADADVALNNNSFGGLRADLPGGPITFGQLYDTFPFDNRLLRLQLSVGTLEQGIANALRRGRRGAIGISGARARVSCSADGLRVELLHPTGQPMRASDTLVVAAMDTLLSGQTFAPIAPGPVVTPPDAPVMREVVEDWLRARGSGLRAEPYLSAANRRVEFDGSLTPCLAN